MYSALITGANRGIGLEFVRQLLVSSEPPQIIFACCRSPENAKDLQGIARSNPAVKILRLDVTDAATLPDAVKTVDGIAGQRGLTLLINNAGIMEGNNCEKADAAQMEKISRVNVIGPLQVTQAFLPALKRAAASTSSDNATMSIQKAAVVNITSKMGSIADAGSGSYVAYRVSKAALSMLTTCMAHDFAPYGIFAAAIYPGWVQTDMGGKNAALTPKKSVCGMLDTLCKFRGREGSGKAYGWDGTVMPW